MIPDFPLGINDVYTQRQFRDNPAVNNHWYWCRRHQEAEHVNTPTKRDDDPTVSCIRIGPFMSEREANRLQECRYRPGGPVRQRPLGMEVEK